MFPTRAGGSTPTATKAGVGMSRHHDPNLAGREAAEKALKNADVDRPDFVFVFGSIGYDQRSLVRAVRETTGGAPLSGCSVEGTINGDDADESNFSVVVTAISKGDFAPSAARRDAFAGGQSHRHRGVGRVDGAQRLAGQAPASRFGATAVKEPWQDIAESIPAGHRPIPTL
jgi:hypothetical protein